jgi:hypothetical protein
MTWIIGQIVLVLLIAPLAFLGCPKSSLLT